MTASSIACTPLFLNALPHSIGTISFLIVRTRNPRLMSSTDRSCPSRYLCVSSSSASAAASTIFSRHFLASSTRFAGMSRNSYFMPCVASSQWIAFMVTRSTTPSNFSSAPIGIWIGIGLPLRRVLMWS